MSRDGDLEPFSESVDDMFTRLGLPDPGVMASLSSEWEELAGPPWAGRSRPLYVKAGTLVVEAVSSSMVAFLRYDESALLKRLERRLGPRRITGIEVRPPGRNDL